MNRYKKIITGLSKSFLLFYPVELELKAELALDLRGLPLLLVLDKLILDIFDILEFLALEKNAELTGIALCVELTRLLLLLLLKLAEEVKI